MIAILWESEIVFRRLEMLWYRFTEILAIRLTLNSFIDHVYHLLRCSFLSNLLISTRRQSVIMLANCHLILIVYFQTFKEKHTLIQSKWKILTESSNDWGTSSSSSSTNTSCWASAAYRQVGLLNRINVDVFYHFLIKQYILSYIPLCLLTLIYSNVPVRYTYTHSVQYSYYPV